MSVPFLRKKGLTAEEFEAQITLIKSKWQKLSARLEIALRNNGGTYLVGETLSYADIVLGHMTTWFLEEVSFNL